MQKVSHNSLPSLLSFLNGSGRSGCIEHKNSPVGQSCPPNEARRQLVFGGADRRVPILAQDLGNLWRKVDIDFGIARDKGEGEVVPQEILEAWRKNSAFIEIALAVALNSAPTLRAGGNEFMAGGDLLRVRRVRDTGHCFIDRFEGKWKPQREDAVATIARYLGLADNFKMMLRFLAILDTQLRAAKIPTGLAHQMAGFSRLSLLTIYARHGGMQSPTRLAFSVLRVAAGGNFTGDRHALARAALRTSKIPDTPVARRRALYTISRLPAEFIGDLCAGRITSWDYFCRWANDIVPQMRGGRALAQFRVFFSIWRACLSKDGRGWRWRGFHHHFCGGRGGVAWQLARLTGVSKSATRDALLTAGVIGFFVISGKSISAAAGWWGKMLKTKIQAAIHSGAFRRMATIGKAISARLYCPAPTAPPTN